MAPMKPAAILLKWLFPSMNVLVKRFKMALLSEQLETTILPELKQVCDETGDVFVCSVRDNILRAVEECWKQTKYVELFEMVQELYAFVYWYLNTLNFDHPEKKKFASADYKNSVAMYKDFGGDPDAKHERLEYLHQFMAAGVPPGYAPPSFSCRKRPAEDMTSFCDEDKKEEEAPVAKRSQAVPKTQPLDNKPPPKDEKKNKKKTTEREVDNTKKTTERKVNNKKKRDVKSEEPAANTPVHNHDESLTTASMDDLFVPLGIDSQLPEETAELESPEPDAEPETGDESEDGDEDDFVQAPRRLGSPETYTCGDVLVMYPDTIRPWSGLPASVLRRPNVLRPFPIAPEGDPRKCICAKWDGSDDGDVPDGEPWQVVVQETRENVTSQMRFQIPFLTTAILCWFEHIYLTCDNVVATGGEQDTYLLVNLRMPDDRANLHNDGDVLAIHVKIAWGDLDEWGAIQFVRDLFSVEFDTPERRNKFLSFAGKMIDHLMFNENAPLHGLLDYFSDEKNPNKILPPDDEEMKARIVQFLKTRGQPTPEPTVTNKDDPGRFREPDWDKAGWDLPIGALTVMPPECALVRDMKPCEVCGATGLALGVTLCTKCFDDRAPVKVNTNPNTTANPSS